MVEENCPWDVIYVRCKGKGVIQNDTEALHLAGERYREAIDDDVCGYGILNFGEGGCGTNDQGLSLAVSDLQKVPAHPAPYVLEAGGEGGGRKGSGGFGVDIDLCIISIAMKMDTMVMEDCAQGKKVDNEEERTQY